MRIIKKRFNFTQSLLGFVCTQKLLVVSRFETVNCIAALSIKIDDSRIYIAFRHQYRRTYDTVDVRV